MSQGQTHYKVRLKGEAVNQEITLSDFGEARLVVKAAVKEGRATEGTIYRITTENIFWLNNEGKTYGGR